MYNDKRNKENTKQNALKNHLASKYQKQSNSTCQNQEDTQAIHKKWTLQANKKYYIYNTVKLWHALRR